MTGPRMICEQAVWLFIDLFASVIITITIDIIITIARKVTWYVLLAKGTNRNHDSSAKNFRL